VGSRPEASTAVCHVLQSLPGVQLLRVDINAIFAEIVADPEAAGLSDVEDSCLAFGVIGHAICSTPNRYLFWDGAHPTTAGHGLLADAALRVITSAP
jgi:phospholipase/lecithinase/hemolysin